MSNLTDDQKAALAKLRVPFAENQISQLPKPTKKRDEMDKLPKATCKICGGYHATTNVIHLSYVGHAALTDRLLDADPAWYWEPMALDPMGYPAIDKDGGLWIKLTVAGVTRLGYGDAQGKSGGDAMKERIGDALRNAAMRFGAALDLWHKGELHPMEGEGDKGEGKGTKETGGEGIKSGAQSATSTQGDTLTAQQTLLKELGEFCQGDEQDMTSRLKAVTAYPVKGSDPPAEKWMTLTDLKKPSDNDKFQKWCGSALGKLRKLAPPKEETCKGCDGILEDGKCWNVNCGEFAG